MLILTVSTLHFLCAFAISAAINGSEDCLLSLCFCVGLFCCIYVAYWLISYFYCKQKVNEITADMDKLFLRQEKLIEKLANLSQLQNEQE